MAEITVLDSAGEEVVETPRTPAEPSSTFADGTLMAERVAQMFNLRPNEVTQNKSKLNTLIEYAKTKTEDHSAEGLKWAIRSLGIKLGTPPLGERLLPYLTRFAYLELEGRKIDQEKDKYLNA